ncbi:MAG: saccharopine dehydrogenase NADP-binding domain-containing protein [Chitinophagaceae bacterium]|nr:saccharopine dehydrogenase NADP-binding domain-containing protein [Chitinophagaceae bacterium]
MKIAVLGAGMVGRTIALDLAKDYAVTSFDYSNKNLELLSKLNSTIKTVEVDLTLYNEYTQLLNPFDIIVIAVPGFMGYKTLEAVIECGKNVADISFFPENALQLNELAIQHQVTAITDIGVAPGMSNLILGRYNEEMQVQNFECYVGGLPKIRKKPFEYKAPFSPIDVLEEYTRPARLQENGFVITRPALSETELMHFDGIGTLEAFNTDGLRSLLFTMNHIPNLKEKTLRYPGHVELIIALKDAGFFNKKTININGIEISPLEFTSKILFKEWKLNDDEEELTVMKVIIDGTENGVTKKVVYELLDEYDTTTKLSSMSCSTGYTCTAAVNLIAKNMFSDKGVFPPEFVGKYQACFEFILNYLKERNVIWKKKELAI